MRHTWGIGVAWICICFVAILGQLTVRNQRRTINAQFETITAIEAQRDSAIKEGKETMELLKKATALATELDEKLKGNYIDNFKLVTDDPLFEQFDDEYLGKEYRRKSIVLCRDWKDQVKIRYAGSDSIWCPPSHLQALEWVKDGRTVELYTWGDSVSFDPITNMLTVFAPARAECNKQTNTFVIFGGKEEW